MKSFKCIFFIVATGLIFQPKIEAIDAIISFFIKEKNADYKNAHQQNGKSISQTLKQPSKSISRSLKQPSFIHAVGKDRSWLTQPGVDGMHASYLGYLATSDQNGQISFPRQQQSDIMHLLITPEVAPEFMISPTLISHWITKKKSPAAFYEISRKKHKGLKVYYFDVKKLKVPQDIPMNTITVYAHPEHVQVPVGISLNTYSTNFILPELQAIKVDSIKNSLYTLSIKQYFEQINIENKNDTPTIATMVMNQ